MFSLKKLIGGVHQKTAEIDLSAGVYFDTTSSPPSIFGHTGFSTTLNGGFGSISPTVVFGKTLTDLYTFEALFVSPDSLRIVLSGPGSQDHFTRVNIPGLGWILSADATTFSGGTNCTWTWTAQITDYADLTSGTVVFE